MSTVQFTRPDGKPGSYAGWAAEVSARWAALSPAEREASQSAARDRFTARVKTQADGPALMHIYDEIGWFGVAPSDVVEALAGIRGDVEVHINSPGGSVFDGMAIYAALRDHPGQVSVVVDGLAASAASFIAMAAAPGQLAMTPNGTMMIHEAWGICAGDAAEMTATAALLDKASANIASVYAERSGRTVPELRDLMRAETWATGQEAVDLGLADTVRKPRAAAPAAEPVPVAASVPWQVTVLPRELHGDADGDDDSAWDGGAAMSAAASSDDPAAAYKAICAGRKGGDPGKQSSWALPHHKHPGDPPNAAGVRNALARLPQTQGLTNEAAARSHLDAHMSAIGGDQQDHAGQMPAWLTNALTAEEAAVR